MTLHLSLLTLDRRSPRWRSLTPHQLHQVVWKGAQGGSERVLYRHDTGGGSDSVLVQSETEPDWSDVSDGTVRTKTFEPAETASGQRLRFRLRANPVVRRRGDAYADGKARRVLVGSNADYVADRLGVEVDDLPDRETQLREWLLRRALRDGEQAFDLALQETPDGPKPALVVDPAQTFRVRRANGGRPLTFVSVDFAGVLRISDPTALAQVVRDGIGRGKAYGFGLLSLAPG